MKPHILTILILLQVNSIFGQTSLKEIALDNGDQNVGFRYYQTSDSTRTYKRIYDWNNQSIPRPIPVGFWYSGNNISNTVEPMIVLDYMEILKKGEY
jgi:hypothetical protein